jgi:prophage regulatory protein
MTTANIQPLFFRLSDVTKRLGLARSTLYAMIHRGAFPAPVKLTDKAIAWPCDQIDAWAAERIAASQNLNQQK